jgi:elongation factor Ts
MSKITAEMVKDLRFKTGVGMTKCKEALVLAEGNMEKAVDHLRKSGMASAVKKEGREAKEGLIGYSESDQDIAIVELNAETDFVAKNERFKEFLNELVEIANEIKPENLEQFNQAPTKQDSSLTVDQKRNLLIQAIGENIQIRKVKILPKIENTSYGIYSHMGGKIVSIVAIEGAEDEQNLARDIAMHVAAESPEYLSPNEIPEEVILREKEIAKSQIKNKPENIVDKIVEGKMKAYYDQVCLVGQKYIKDPSQTVEQFVQSYAKEHNKSLKIHGFWRWKIGQ